MLAVAVSVGMHVTWNLIARRQPADAFPLWWVFFGGEGEIAENLRHAQRKVIKSSPACQNTYLNCSHNLYYVKLKRVIIHGYLVRADKPTSGQNFALPHCLPLADRIDTGEVNCQRRSSQPAVPINIGDFDFSTGCTIKDRQSRPSQLMRLRKRSQGNFSASLETAWKE
jgi:hypothetical protein